MSPSAVSATKPQSQLLRELETLVQPIERLESTIKELEAKADPLIAGRTGTGGDPDTDGDRVQQPAVFERIMSLKERLSRLAERANDLVNDIRI